MTRPSTEQSPPGLAGFQGRLEAAAEADLRRRRRNRRIAIRAGSTVAVAVIALVVLSVVNVFGAGGPSIVERAAAALAPSCGNTIRHIHLVATVPDGKGGTAGWDEETWTLLVSPYSFRSVQAARPGFPPAESATNGNLGSQIYDPATNTVYVYEAVAPSEADLQKKAQLEGKTVEQMKQDDAAKAAVGFKDKFQGVVDRMLASGKATVDRDLVVDGRHAVRITGVDGDADIIYTVDAKTYDPIEFQVVPAAAGTDKANAATTMRFLAYDTLPATDANLALFDLAAQHPGATVDRDPQDFAAAQLRLFGKDQPS
jgi:hypothetical protein